MVAFDGALLARLVAGDVGDLRWSLTDDDHGEHLAGGDDAASLAAYLG